MERERAVWKGELVTVVDRGITNVTVRDAYGFTHSVRKRDVKPLDKSDDRAKFKAPGPNE